jgi:transcriptional regulator with PAS, ATPase and Fis domain
VDAELLLALAAEVADKRHTRDVLDTIVGGFADLPGVVLAGIWLLRPCDLCEKCSLQADCPDRAQCLHLVASAGNSQNSAELWSPLQDHLQQIPLNFGQLAEDAATDWLASPDWVRREQIRGSTAHPLVTREKLLGTLVVFMHDELRNGDSDRLGMFADQAAAALVHAEVFEELSRADAGLRQVVNVVRHHLTIIEPGLGSVFANRAALDYFGLTGQLPALEFLEKVTHTEDLAKVLKGVQQAISRGEFFETEARMRGRDEQYRWFLYQLYSLRDEAGQVFRWCAVRTDIDDQKKSQESTQRENLALREEIDKLSMSEEIVGSSATLRAVLTRVVKVAASDVTVLITGETGTGKELIARAIHKRSRRAERAFISVNCAAIPKDLIASELFGHEKGAFTGALQRRLGRFELAEGGTIFLDEIGELPAETQIALLRVLQEREFQRVGGNQTMHADVRVIAATHRDLPGAIEAGTFRSDLFYRINVFPIHIPPLRERKEDIQLLLEYFIHRYSSRAGKHFRQIEKKSLKWLESYPWPGNIRELQNIVERSVILCDTETFSVDENWLSFVPAAGPPLPQVLVAQERERVEAALASSKGRVSGPSGAAKKLGIPRTTLESRIKSLKIDKNRFE